MAPEALAKILSRIADKTTKAGTNSRDPEVAKRRSLVKANRDASACDLCQIFDRERVPLPYKWQAAGFTSWVRAYKERTYRSRIDVLVSKDRRIDRR